MQKFLRKMENRKPPGWKKSWLGTPLGLSQRGGRSQKVEYIIPQSVLAPRDGSHLTTPTKARGEACTEAFFSLEFSFWNEIRHRQTLRRWLAAVPLPTDAHQICWENVSFHTRYLHFLILDLTGLPIHLKRRAEFFSGFPFFFFSPVRPHVPWNTQKSLTQCAPPGIQSLSHWVTSCQGGYIITKEVFISFCRQNSGYYHEMRIIWMVFVDG